MGTTADGALGNSLLERLGLAAEVLVEEEEFQRNAGIRRDTQIAETQARRVGEVELCRRVFDAE
jgi:hypothetical protein